MFLSEELIIPREVPVMEDIAAAGKKRKLGLEESELRLKNLFHLKTRRLDATSESSGELSVNCGYSACECWDDVVIPAVCSSHGSSELDNIQKQNIDEETGDLLNCRERRGTSQLLEVPAESGELESTARPLESDYRRPFTPGKMPSEHELEEFFTASEKNMQKEFIDKYNFDIAKDEPLEGRYDWVHISTEAIMAKIRTPFA